jgi:hypothetical protein
MKKMLYFLESLYWQVLVFNLNVLHLTVSLRKFLFPPSPIDELIIKKNSKTDFDDCEC